MSRDESEKNTPCRTNLCSPAFQIFPLSSITPQGWLKDQLQIQADGLSGHLDQFWPDIQNSAWIGGNAEGWERMPYWLDGAIPLAWLLRNSRLQGRLEEYVQEILLRQERDGWLGPRIEEKKEAADLWSQALALKMLLVYYHASGNPAIPGAVERALRQLDRHIDTQPLSHWGQFRWFEFLIPLWWLYERSGAPWLLDLAVKLRSQGFHWKDFFHRWPLTAATEPGRWNYAGHGVNNAMALKEGALWWRLSGETADLQAPYTMLENLDQYHGTAAGMFTADECLAGLSSTQGTELCAVVETMYSLEWLIQIGGDPLLADRLERIAFNALPAALAPDMWSHQYDQQVNQVECSIRQDRPWNTNGPDANIFGLEPHFGCCTANFSQGWPKLAAHLWLQPREGGIASAAYAPSRLETTLQGIPVTLETTTDYPFREEITIIVKPSQPVDFPLLLRIPGWTEAPVVTIAGEQRSPQPGTFFRIDRRWEGTVTVHLRLPMPVSAIPRPRQTIALHRGPLLLALPIQERWEPVHQELPHREPPHGDWEVYPESPWNYGLKIHPDHPKSDVRLAYQAWNAGPFSPANPPLTAEVPACRLPGWTSRKGSAGPPPAPSTNPGGTSSEILRLIPYGCTNLRIAEFPLAPPAANPAPETREAR